MAPSVHGFSTSFLFRVLLAIAIPAAVVLAMLDTALGWLVLPTLVGGAITAGVLFRLRSRPAPATDDVLAHGTPGSQIMNMSSIRVSGLGGLGLVIVALTMVFEFPLVRAVVLAG